MEKQKESWNSKIGFILSAAGSAIGLGNLWKFPYIAGQNGGGTFIIIYAVLMLLVGIPLLVNDFVVGRFAQHPNVLKIFHIDGKPTFFSKFSFIYVLVNILIMSYYFVVFGWTLYYLIQSISGGLSFAHNVNKDYYLTFLNNFIASPKELIFYTTLGILSTIAINLLGIVNGIEKASLIMLPLLFIILIALAVKSLTLPGAEAGVRFYLSFDMAHFTFKTIAIALGQVLFSLSLGTATMVVYASYLKKDNNLLSAANATTIMGFLVAVFAGLIIFPSTFALGYDVTAGKGLVFVTFPAILAQLPLSRFFAILFFLLLVLATITSAISVAETVVGAFMEKLKISRTKTLILLAVITFFISIPQELSLNTWQNIKIFSMSIFDITDYFVSVILMPLGGLLSCLFAGQILKKYAKEEFTNYGNLNKRTVIYWYRAIRYVLPFIIIVIFIFGFFS